MKSARKSDCCFPHTGTLGGGVRVCLSVTKFVLFSKVQNFVGKCVYLISNIGRAPKGALETYIRMVPKILFSSQMGLWKMARPKNL